ncbi:hypothetical protein [Carboxydocella sp. JDF658]|uniref:hypothetical protein n=1 Tax=Carboxydocella sp. JDF658 TaxID=1926600 RepID=UPI0009AEEEB2|nr:hypothetical protein [Carboxydocella sp. JDF658]GAW30616.1 hypothetical protein JDF658_03810 [Carboxydocella sp. JDF658]
MLTRPPLVLDTDVISCFAWVKRMDILEKLYSGKMVVPAEVVYEISNRRVQHLKAELTRSVDKKYIEVVSLQPLGDDGQTFVALRETGKYGSGEAAVMAYAKVNGGTICSNNLRDVLRYCQKYNLALLSTRAIMYDAICKKVISETEAQNVWTEMINKKRQLPCKTIKEVIDFYKYGPGAKLGLQKY